MFSWNSMLRARFASSVRRAAAVGEGEWARGVLGLKVSGQRGVLEKVLIQGQGDEGQGSSRRFRVTLRSDTPELLASGLGRMLLIFGLRKPSEIGKTHSIEPLLNITFPSQTKFNISIRLHFNNCPDAY